MIGSSVRCLSLLLALSSVVAIPGVARAATVGTQEAQRSMDTLWMLIAAGLVFMMQIGFLLLEAGQVRSKNSVNVAQKNLLDFSVASLIFGLFGFAIMFGPSIGGVVGWSWDYAFFNFSDHETLTFFIFQMMFAGTAATIVSGAVAERMTLAGYVAVTAILAGFVYPIAGHWTWGGDFSGDDAPFLASWGFIDFAGSTVVHSVGAWAGLAAALIIGPRAGKYDEDGQPRKFYGHSPVLATAGALLIWVGWIGFNGGATAAGTPAFVGIIGNTMTGGVVGAVVQLVLGRVIKGYSRPEFMINGALSGLVGVTAGCAVISLQSAVLTGAIASFVCFWAREWLDSKGVDDPLGAVAVHGFAGAAGTILVGVFAPTEALSAGDRLSQIGVQVAGVAIYFIWAFGTVFAALWLVMRMLPTKHDGPGRGLRVSPEDESVGLNVAEHNAPMGMVTLVEGMTQILNLPHEKVPEVPEEPGDESYELAVLLNRIIAQLNDRADIENARTERMRRTLKELAEAIHNAEQGDLSGRISIDGECEFFEIAHDFNSMLTKLEGVLGQMSQTTEILVDVASRMTQQSATMETSAQNQVDKVASLSTVLNDMQANLSANAERVVEAQGKMEQSRSFSEDVRKSSESMVDRIDHATDGALEIEQSIDKIDTIALETRLLSLNASVEAARAGGEAASGFAVVAQEVRKLADTSAASAQAVRDTIKDVVVRSQDAKSEVDKTHQFLDDMLKLANELSDLIAALGAVSEASNETIQRVADTIMEVEATSVEVLSEAAETEGLSHSLQAQALASQQVLSNFTGSDQQKAA